MSAARSLQEERSARGLPHLARGIRHTLPASGLLARGDLRADAARAGARHGERTALVAGAGALELPRARRPRRPAGRGLLGAGHPASGPRGGAAAQHRRVLRGVLRAVPAGRAAGVRAARASRRRDRLLLRVHRGRRLHHPGPARGLRLPHAGRAGAREGADPAAGDRRGRAGPVHRAPRAVCGRRRSRLRSRGPATWRSSSSRAGAPACPS